MEILLRTELRQRLLLVHVQELPRQARAVVIGLTPRNRAVAIGLTPRGQVVEAALQRRRVLAAVLLALQRHRVPVVAVLTVLLAPVAEAVAPIRHRVPVAAAVVVLLQHQLVPAAAGAVEAAAEAPPLVEVVERSKNTQCTQPDQ